MISFTEKSTEFATGLPIDAQAAMAMAFDLDGFAEQENLWARQPATLARLTGDTDGYSFTVALSEVSPAGASGNTVDMIKAVKPADLTGPRGNHMGFLLLSEAFDTDTDTEDVVAVLTSGGELPQGQHLRLVLGVLVSGWRVMLCRVRGGQAQGVLAEPGEGDLLPDYTHQILGPLDDLNRRFAG